MSWNYSTTKEEIMVAVADGYWHIDCKTKCLRDRLVCKFYCPKCGEEWSDQMVVTIGSAPKAHIQPLAKYYVRARSYSDLKRKLKNKRVIYHESSSEPKLTPKQLLERIGDYFNVEYEA